MVAFVGRELPAEVADAISARPVAGVTLFVHHNVDSPGQVRALTRAAPGGAPGRAAADAHRHRPGGRPAQRARHADDPVRRARWRSARQVTRISPSAWHGRRRSSCARSASTSTTRRCATSPPTPPIPASASARSATIRRPSPALAAATVRGLQAEGVAATAKHFPGSGEAAADTHHELAVGRRRSIAPRSARAGPVSRRFRSRRAAGDGRPPGAA